MFVRHWNPATGALLAESMVFVPEQPSAENSFFAKGEANVVTLDEK